MKNITQINILILLLCANLLAGMQMQLPQMTGHVVAHRAAMTAQSITSAASQVPPVPGASRRGISRGWITAATVATVVGAGLLLRYLRKPQQPVNTLQPNIEYLIGLQYQDRQYAGYVPLNSTTTGKQVIDAVATLKYSDISDFKLICNGKEIQYDDNVASTTYTINPQTSIIIVFLPQQTPHSAESEFQSTC